MANSIAETYNGWVAKREAKQQAERERITKEAKSSLEMEAPNCYPRCSNPTLIRNLKALNPCIDISVLRTSFPFEDFGKAKDMAKLINVYKGAQAQATQNSGLTIEQTTGEGKDQKTENVDASSFTEDSEIGNLNGQAISSSDASISIFGNLYGFISLMSAYTEKICSGIPIFSSPQIRVNNGMGWKKEQSLFNFIQTILNNSPAGSIAKALLGDKGSNIAAGIANSIETIGAMAGWSPRVSPYFSLKDNPFGSTPSLSVEIQLINDCVESVQANSNFLNTIVRETIIGSATARDKGKGTDSRFWMRWYPPKLFNVGLKFGANAKQYVKRYHVCTLESTVESVGVIRNGIPDVYKVNLTFSSLMPDTLDMWTGNDGSFPTLEGSTSGGNSSGNQGSGGTPANEESLGSASPVDENDNNLIEGINASNIAQSITHNFF